MTSSSTQSWSRGSLRCMYYPQLCIWRNIIVQNATCSTVHVYIHNSCFFPPLCSNNLSLPRHFRWMPPPLWPTPPTAIVWWSHLSLMTSSISYYPPQPDIQSKCEPPLAYTQIHNAFVLYYVRIPILWLILYCFGFMSDYSVRWNKTPSKDALGKFEVL